ncbi:hypothetical protein K493DRAFT_361317 [Basidiobolus meristosporus CBS 931.73]|uniref:Uncharacterized protein n=1 Tax=Basidiobolus meristosporus CBS 931.73 TaxID=1314790 RepID=A0A1Y1XAM6_9FUNG|nr:hypothetical protein K493DRAFT_361317 [Basidiobolus meristosporus CBS 931.73]|eukprot:ORX82802.1 hypothetical protein K493DRAFT_361317 [Basidiobolus meristosporus CBS 931.73]
MSMRLNLPTISIPQITFTPNSRHPNRSTALFPRNASKRTDKTREPNFSFAHVNRSFTTLRANSFEHSEHAADTTQYLNAPLTPIYDKHPSELLSPPELRVSGSSDDEETDYEDEDDRFFEQRDQYGFKKSTQYSTKDDYERFISNYEPIVQRRREKWNMLIKNYHGSLPVKSPTIKRYIRKGIPNDVGCATAVQMFG